MTKLSRVELLRKKIEEEKKRKTEGASGGNNFGNSTIYPFWNMATGDEARVRILADANEDNPNLFFVDRLEHKLSIGDKDRRIPCRAMYDEDCPICVLSRKYYKDEGKTSKNGKYYYRTKQSLVRLLILKDPLDPDQTTGENRDGKVLNSQFGYQLMEKIKEQIGSDDLGDFTDLDEGFDFVIKKTPQGEYGTYSVGSGFARRPSAIDDALQDGVELIDISTLIPEDWGYDKVHAILEAHLNGTDFEDDATPARRQVAESSDKPAPRASARREEADTPEPTTRRTAAPREEAEEEPAPTRRTAPAPAPAPEPEGEDDDEDAMMQELLARRRAAKANK